MTIKPEDVRKHLETKQSDAQTGPDTGAAAAADTAAGAALAAAGTALTEGAVAEGAVAAAIKKKAILESISASYFGLRLGMAVLAFALPILLWLGAGYDNLQGSISAYYHYSPSVLDPLYGAGTVRDVLVGVLCAAGAALYFYKGYDWKENLALNIGGIAAIVLALAPMDWPHTEIADKSFVSLLHTGAAVVFFLAIAFVCLFCSGATLNEMEEGERRNKFKLAYMVLGTLMIVLPLSVVALDYLRPRETASYVTFAIEVVAIYVFAVFWLVKSWEIAILEKL